MPEDLTGYEASELERIAALLEAGPDNAEALYYDTIGFDPRAIGVAAAQRAVSGSQDLASVLAQGNDANALRIENVADGVAMSDVATVGQIAQAGMILVTQHLTASDLLSISTAKQTLPAPGDDKIIAVFNIVANFRPGITQYQGGANVFAGYGDPSSGWFDPLIRAADICLATGTLSFGTLSDYTSFSTVPLEQIANQPWSIHADSDFTDGDGTLDVFMWYTILDVASLA